MVYASSRSSLLLQRSKCTQSKIRLSLIFKEADQLGAVMMDSYLNLHQTEDPKKFIFNISTAGPHQPLRAVKISGGKQTKVES